MSIHLSALTCPQCGSPLSITRLEALVICEYCACTVAIERKSDNLVELSQHKFTLSGVAFTERELSKLDYQINKTINEWLREYRQRWESEYNQEANVKKFLSEFCGSFGGIYEVGDYPILDMYRVIEQELGFDLRHKVSKRELEYQRALFHIQLDELRDRYISELLPSEKRLNEITRRLVVLGSKRMTSRAKRDFILAMQDPPKDEIMPERHDIVLNLRDIDLPNVVLQATLPIMSAMGFMELLEEMVEQVFAREGSRFDYTTPIKITMKVLKFLAFDDWKTLPIVLFSSTNIEEVKDASSYLEEKPDILWENKHLKVHISRKAQRLTSSPLDVSS